MTCLRPHSHRTHGRKTRNRTGFVHPSWRWFTFNTPRVTPPTPPPTLLVWSRVGLHHPAGTCSCESGLLLPPPPRPPAPTQQSEASASSTRPPGSFPAALGATPMCPPCPHATRPGPRLSPPQRVPPPTSPPRGLYADRSAPLPCASPRVTRGPRSSPSALHSSGCLTPMVFNLCSSSEEVSCRTKYKATE